MKVADTTFVHTKVADTTFIYKKVVAIIFPPRGHAARSFAKVADTTFFCKVYGSHLGGAAEGHLLGSCQSRRLRSRTATCGFRPPA